MRIESDIKLDFSDVLLKPKRSTLKSRKDIELSRRFKFRWTDLQWEGVPVISSNMTSVTTPDAAKAMVKRNMLACVPKNANLPSYGAINKMYSLGLEDKPLSTLASFLCLDVPNGYIEAVVDRTKWLREEYPGKILVVGNVVTAEQTEALILAGADIIKVGIGSGAACSTRIKTGVGMPQLSAVMECADAAHGLSGHVISDGGCTTAGDIVKAFAAGADFVMLGGMLAGHTENAETCPNCHGKTTTEPFGALCLLCNNSGKVNSFYGSSSERGNEELAGGIKDYRASEGWELRLPDRGSIDRTLQDIEGGLRSACSYVGARSLKDLPKCATFVMVNRQANQSLWEHRI